MPPHTPGVHTPCPPPDEEERTVRMDAPQWQARIAPDPPRESAPRCDPRLPQQAPTGRLAPSPSTIERPGLLRTSSEKRRIKSVSMHHRRVADKTATPMQAEMWLMSASDFVELSSLERHQTMREQHKLVRWDPSRRHIFFVSHQWTSFDHPDHTQQQLHTFQALLRRMMNGSCPETTPSLADASLFTSAARITSDEWREIVDDAHIWMDIFSVPQEGTYHSPRTPGTSAELIGSVSFSLF